MAGRIASKLIAAAKANRKPITPAAAKRLAAAKPFNNPHRTMAKLATSGLPRSPRVRPAGMPKPPRRRVPR